MKHLVFSRLTHLPKRGPGTALLAVLLAVVLGAGMFAFAPSPSAHAATIPRTAAAVPAARGSVTVIISGRTSPALIPLSASGCVGTLPWNNVQTCFGIVGSGKYVVGMWVSAYVRNSAVTLALQISGPSVHDYSAFVLVGRGHKVIMPITLQRNVNVGQYCGQSIVLGPGSGKACENVRA